MMLALFCKKPVSFPIHFSTVPRLLLDVRCVRDIHSLEDGKDLVGLNLGRKDGYKSG